MTARKRRPRISVVYGAVIAAFTVFVLLDTFVVQDVYQAEATSGDLSSAFASARANAESDSSSSSSTPDGSSDDPAGEGASENSKDRPSASGGSAESGKPSESGSSAESGKRHGPGKHGSGSGKGTGSGSGKGMGAGKGGSSTSSQATDVSISENAVEHDSYSDDNVSITLKEYSVSDTQVYVADVQASSAEYLKTAFANNSYGKNVTAKTSEIAAQNDAVLAINGDYYGVQEAGYVIRNGQVYRSTSNGATDIACFYADGTMRIRNTGEVSAEELVAEGVWQAFSFGPALVEDGNVSVSAGDEVGKAMASNPRTAIGIIDDNHYVFVVSDGRTDESVGLSLTQLANFLQEIGVKCAYNLDGGGTSAMYYQGEIVNKPTTTGTIEERGVSDIVYIG